MKNYLKIFILFCFFSSCSGDDIEFDGARTGLANRFVLDFNVLNKTFTHTMELETGDVLDVEITKEKGEIDIAVTDSEEKVIYKGDNASSNKFSIVISKDDEYLFEVTGRKAAGYVSFILKEK